jgi:hypothetical protein
MFVQFIEGTVHDRAGLRRLFDRWHEEQAPHAEGWLGSTAGVADDGTCLIAARFASAEDARRNSDRPEQGAWWEELVKHFDGPPAVHDCGTAVLWGDGGSDDAAFVQVLAMDVLDGDRVRAAVSEIEGTPRPEERPDIIGGLFAVADDDSRAFEVVYFTTEEDARRGEATMGDPAEDPTWAPLIAALGQPRFIDLREPWLTSP